MDSLCIKNNISFKGKIPLHPGDLEYKKLLQKGIRDTFHLECKIEDMVSIAGPAELKKIIDNLKPSQYKVGKNFRANFHLHTDASDGKMSLKDMLDSCMEWIEQLRKNKIKNDNLPLFSAAITDHDTIKNTKNAMALIVQNPEKYRDFRFVSGCEFLLHSKKDNVCFEAVGLGFNPFDTKLDRLTKGFFSNNQVSDIKDIKEAGGILSWAHPFASAQNVNEDFVRLLKSYGIDGAEANYQYTSADSEYIQAMSGELERLMEKHNMFKTGGTDSHGVNIFSGAF